jgi:methionine sulfoxide reductase catalytic subunit
MGMKRHAGLGPAIPEREATPESVYLRRRELLRAGARSGLALGLGGSVQLAAAPAAAASVQEKDYPQLAGVKPSKLSTGEPRTPWQDVVSYNNFYEFGTGKDDPARNAHTLKTRPWTIQFEGEIARAQTMGIDKLLKSFPLEERIYRHRCVEAWSMVVPWVGFPLGPLLAQLQPTSKAKYVAFTTLHAPDQMPGQRRGVLDWPYVEGLRLDEAMHPLAMLAVGVYGRVMPSQNGAPIRLVVPWKYGFKGAKSIVKISFTEKQPDTAWNLSAPSEYGFYANVNPEVDHPRWSQARERRLGEFLKRKTLAFNGYGGEVYGMYKGMDLSRHY